jgi:Flp pilus assembly protein TadG
MHSRRGRQRGVAAVELAILLPVFILVMAPLILYARYMWHYTVAQKAAQDAARYMSTVSATEMRSKTLAAYAQAVAVQIARTEVAELAPGDVIPDADVSCDTRNPCTPANGTALPQNISVLVYFNFSDPLFNVYLGPYGKSIEAKVTMRYVGR